MDEHIVVSGRTLSLPGLLVDHSLKPLGWWIEKHNMYASREAVDLLNMERQFLPKSVGNAALRGRAKVRRVLKERLYRRLPGGLRAFVYFAYRFVFRLGFLDGRAASFHVLQGFWYRYLVDLKVMEVRRFQQATGASVVEAIRKVLGIDVDLHTNRSA